MSEPRPFFGSRSARQAYEAKAIFDTAEDAGRDLTADERARVKSLLEDAELNHTLEQKMGDLGRKLGAPDLVPDSPVALGALTPGERFTRSDGYKSVRSGRGENWSSGLVDVGPVGLSMKGTLLEGTGSPGTGTAGGLVPVPQVVPGYVEKLFQPLTLEALLLSGQATTNTVRYAVQGTATSGAAGVAEGGTKPESTLAYSTLDEPVKKVATSIVISDETLEDAPAIQQLINGQLGLFVRIEAERQLLRGTSGGNEVQGLLTSRSVPVYAGGTAAGNKAVQLFKAMNGMRGSAFLEPEWVVMHPTDWQEIRLLTDTAGQLLGGGPFMGPYGSGSNLSASGQVTGAVDTLWNKPVYISAAIGAGTALIGNSQSAQVWNRGGLSVEATNSHASNFVLNLTAIRAERRLALCVYRSNGFVEARIS
jgi:HK97 family phage major capsid protein